jgi:hypothetical protein
MSQGWDSAVGVGNVGGYCEYSQYFSSPSVTAKHTPPLFVTSITIEKCNKSPVVQANLRPQGEDLLFLSLTISISLVLKKSRYFL